MVGCLRHQIPLHFTHTSTWLPSTSKAPDVRQQECCYSKSSLLFSATVVWVTILRHLNLRMISAVAASTSPVDPERLYALRGLFRLSAPFFPGAHGNSISQAHSFTLWPQGLGFGQHLTAIEPHGPPSPTARPNPGLPRTAQENSRFCAGPVGACGRYFF